MSNKNKAAQVPATLDKADDNIVRKVETLEAACVFRGEQVESFGIMTSQEAIRLGVSLVIRGEESKARGVFVIANASAKLATADQKEKFMSALRSEMENEAIERAVSLLPDNTPDKAKTLAKDAARAEGKKRFDNLGQTIRAAKWALENISAVADSVSVYTLAQANRYLEEPKDGQKDAEEVKAVRKAVMPLLKKAGTSQAAVKAAIAKAKSELAEAQKPKDERTDEQKKADELQGEMRQLVSRFAVGISKWDELTAKGVSPADIRSIPVKIGESRTLVNVILDLATLAGLNVTESK